MTMLVMVRTERMMRTTRPATSEPDCCYGRAGLDSGGETEQTSDPHPTVPLNCTFSTLELELIREIRETGRGPDTDGQRLLSGSFRWSSALVAEAGG